MKISEIRKLSSSELTSNIAEMQRRLFELRLSQATKQSAKPHLFKKYKHILAQLLTEEHKFRSGVR